eukprot:6872549-Alexandrium_andersonii.AAC.1
METPLGSRCPPSESMGRVDEPNPHRCWTGSAGASWALAAGPRGAGLRLRAPPPRGPRTDLVNREYRGPTPPMPTMRPNTHPT